MVHVTEYFTANVQIIVYYYILLNAKSYVNQYVYTHMHIRLSLKGTTMLSHKCVSSPTLFIDLSKYS